MPMKRRSHLQFPLRQEDVFALNEFLDEVDLGVEDSSIRKVADNSGVTTKKLRFHDLGELTIGTTEEIFRHNLGETPHFVMVTMRTGGTIFESSTADKYKVYLTADAASSKARVIVFG